MIIECPFCRANASTPGYYADHLRIHHGFESDDAIATALRAFAPPRARS